MKQNAHKIAAGSLRALRRTAGVTGVASLAALSACGYNYQSANIFRLWTAITPIWPRMRLIARNVSMSGCRRRPNINASSKHSANPT